MKVTMSRMEYLALEHSKRFSSDWDYFAIAMGAYLSGHREAKSCCFDKVVELCRTQLSIDETTPVIFSVNNESVEVDLTDGEHQLSAATFEKWRKNAGDIKAAMNSLVQFDFQDIRVDEKDGVISFQGTARRK